MKSNIKSIYDYNKEYTLQEVFEFEEETEFECRGYKIIIKDNILFCCFDIGKDKWMECVINKNWVIAKYKLIQIEKEVTFQEVLSSEGKCRVEHGLINKIIEPDYLQVVLLWLCNYYNTIEIKEIIKHGKWFIKEVK